MTPSSLNRNPTPAMMRSKALRHRRRTSAMQVHQCTRPEMSVHLRRQVINRPRKEINSARRWDPVSQTLVAAPELPRERKTEGRRVVPTRRVGVDPNAIVVVCLKTVNHQRTIASIGLLRRRGSQVQQASARRLFERGVSYGAEATTSKFFVTRSLQFAKLKHVKQTASYCFGKGRERS